jgi:hypothetical protein
MTIWLSESYITHCHELYKIPMMHKTTKKKHKKVLCIKDKSFIFASSAQNHELRKTYQVAYLLGHHPDRRFTGNLDAQSDSVD